MGTIMLYKAQYAKTTIAGITLGWLNFAYFSLIMGLLILTLLDILSVSVEFFYSVVMYEMLLLVVILSLDALISIKSEENRLIRLKKGGFADYALSYLWLARDRHIKNGPCIALSVLALLFYITFFRISISTDFFLAMLFPIVQVVLLFIGGPGKSLPGNMLRVPALFTLFGLTSMILWWMPEDESRQGLVAVPSTVFIIALIAGIMRMASHFFVPIIYSVTRNSKISWPIANFLAFIVVALSIVMLILFWIGGFIKTAEEWSLAILLMLFFITQINSVPHPYEYREIIPSKN